MVAIVFLGSISFGTAFRFGEWGERSIIESMLVVTKEKMNRVQDTISATNSTYFHIVDPKSVLKSCDRWRQTVTPTTLVEAAALIDDHGDIVSFFYRDPDRKRAQLLYNMVKREVVPLLDKYESFYQYKHLHRPIWGEHRLITHLTTNFDGEDYTACLIYDNRAIEKELFRELLKDVGKNRVANVVDDKNEIIYGRPIGSTEEFIVSRRFPSTLYKWRLQIAPTSKALFSPKEQARAKRLTQMILIPLALGVIVLGLVALYLANVRERRLGRLKSDFIADVTHEFKTPLSLIRMFGELLLMGKVTDEAKAKRYYEVILRETERLTTLIDNVLNIARIERGKELYDFRIMNAAEAVEHGLEIYRNRLEKSDLKLEYFADRNLPPARIDGNAITLAVVNLIDNAAKYAEGTDRIRVEVTHVKGQIIISVIDHGVGIPTPEIKRVFDRFYRVPSPQLHKQRGTGIGLSLVKHIAEGHGGTVRVTSIPGSETRFSIRIPPAPSEKRPSVSG